MVPYMCAAKPPTTHDMLEVAGGAGDQRDKSGLANATSAASSLNTYNIILSFNQEVQVKTTPILLH